MKRFLEPARLEGEGEGHRDGAEVERTPDDGVPQAHSAVVDLGPMFPAEAAQQLCFDDARLAADPTIESSAGTSGIDDEFGCDHGQFSDLITEMSPDG